MSDANKGYLMALYKTPYFRALGESSETPFANLDITDANYQKRAFCAPGERFAVPNSNIVIRWVRVRGSGVVAGTLLKLYAGRTGTLASATAGTVTTATTLPVSDVGAGIFSTTGGTGLNQHRHIYDSDGATNASKLTLLESDISNYLSDASLPEALNPVPDATTTWRIYCPWEVQPHAAATDRITAVALGTVTDGNWTFVVEEGLVPARVVGTTDALTADGFVVPSATAGVGKGVTTAGITAGDASLVFARSIDAYSGAAALRLIDMFGRFRQ
jgi:hypothetical protein